MTVKRPVLRYYGGKWKMAPWIISNFPPHRVYVEVFGGAASVLLQKTRAYAEIYNDIDLDIVNLFQVLRDSASSQRLIELLRLTPYSRQEFLDAFDKAEEPVEKARRLIIRSLQGYSGTAIFKEYGGFRSAVRRVKTVYQDWAEYPNYLIEIIDRLQSVCIERSSWEKMISRYDSLNTLFYLDPPYLPETRLDMTSRYNYELSREEHEALLERVLSITGMAIISGYPSDMYDDRLSGWMKVTKPNNGTMSTEERTEVLWISPSALTAKMPLFGGLGLDENGNYSK